MEISKPKIILKEIDNIKCEECGKEYFREVFSLKKVSKILTGSQDDILVPYPHYQCVSCFHVQDETEKTNIITDENI